MPVFKPFQGLRPAPDYIHSFPTPPLSNFSQEEIEKKSEKPFSYVKMVAPYLFGKKEDMQDNLGQVRANFEKLVQENCLVKDELCYYLYSQKMPDGRVFRGLLGLVSVEDFNAGKIKKHEETLTHRKDKLSRYLEGVNIQAEPVLLTYSSHSELEKLMDEEEQKTPEVDFTDDRGIAYKIWTIGQESSLAKIQEELASVEAFYIADGHHRMGATALCAERKAKENPHHTGEELYNFVYSFIVSDQSIKINDFNKVITDMNGLITEELLARLEENFIVEERGERPYFPSQKRDFCMYLEGKFYNLTFKKCADDEGCIGIIDHYLLEKYVLNPILGIQDLKTSKRVDYVRGTCCIEGINRLKNKVDNGNYQLAFGVYPVSFEDLVEIADNQLKMPPKGTYIEPKLVTALVMYDMK